MRILAAHRIMSAHGNDGVDGRALSTVKSLQRKDELPNGVWQMPLAPGGDDSEIGTRRSGRFRRARWAGAQRSRRLGRRAQEKAHAARGMAMARRCGGCAEGSSCATARATTSVLQRFQQAQRDEGRRKASTNVFTSAPSYTRLAGQKGSAFRVEQPGQQEPSRVGQRTQLASPLLTTKPALLCAALLPFTPLNTIPLCRVFPLLSRLRPEVGGPRPRSR